MIAHSVSMPEPEGLPYLQLFLAFSLIVYVAHTYLDFRQLKAVRLPTIPAELGKHISRDLFQKTQAYSLDKWWLGLWHNLCSITQTVLLLSLQGLPWLWDVSGAVLAQTQHMSFFLHTEVAQTVVFVLILLISNMCVELPWDLYSTFVIEERHGFNKQTSSLYLFDMLKQVVLSFVFVPPVVAGITVLLQHSGPLLPLYLWGFILVLSLVMMTVYPVLIAPLFNKFEALQEGTLRVKIEALATALAFPLKKLYTMDGSKRSGHSNAYMYGFWKNKRIVLYDTLITQCSEDQVVAVLAHELGHWKLRHTPLLFAINQVTMLAHFSLFTLVQNNSGLFTSFGFVQAKPVFVSLVLFQLIMSPLDEVMRYVSNVISRTFEFQADDFAVSLGHCQPLKAALLKLEEENKSSINVDPFYSSYHYSHPPLTERLRAIKAADKKRS